MTYDVEPLPGTPEEEPPRMTVEDERPCLQCGYSLRGLPISGNCPECGMSVRNSVRGAMLRFSDPAYLARLHIGIKLIEWGVALRAAAVVCLIPLLLLRPPRGSFYANTMAPWLLFIPVYLAAYIGWWLFTSVDPGLQPADPSRRMRLTIRATILIAVMLTAGSVVADYLAPSWGGVWERAAMSVAAIGWAVRTMVAIRYCIWLAKRGEDQKAVITGETLTWVVPVLSTVGFAMLGLGPLVAFALYLGFLDDIRRELALARAIRRKQLTTPPAGPTAAARPSPPGP